MRLRFLIILMAACGMLPATTPAQAQDDAAQEQNDGAEQINTPPAPPTGVTAADNPNDVGNAVVVSWELSPDDQEDASPRRVLKYDVYRKAVDEEGAEFELINSETYQKTEHIDREAKRGTTYTYYVRAVSPPTEEHPDGLASEPSNQSNQIAPTMQFFVETKAWFGILLLIVGGAVFYYIESAKKGKDLRVRKIAGLEAVTEAVGRATEMGRPVLYINGIQDINDIQTIAGVTILGNVAKVCAQYDASIEVPTARSLVMTTARETVQNAYLSAGRPDAYNEDNIYYLTDEQFGFVAGVVGTMVREKPAACFYMGAFYAESLMLAETGNSIGAIQVAGTAMPSQLPFFVAACDYTLIGEEFFAASAYLSGEPHQLGSLKGQDVGKLIAAVFIVLGCLAATVGFEGFAEFLRSNVMGNGGFMP